MLLLELHYFSKPASMHGDREGDELEDRNKRLFEAILRKRVVARDFHDGMSWKRVRFKRRKFKVGPRNSSSEFLRVTKAC